MSSMTSSISPLRSAPKFITVSISRAPSSTAVAAARAFTSARSQPCGKPMTLTTRVSLPASASAATRTQYGWTQ